jgi:hypothetical protein
MRILVTEKQIKGIIKEYYDRDKLYHRESVVRRLMSKNNKGFFNAPKQIRDIVKDLPYLECYDSDGNKQICTKIPEVLYVYLSGRY